MKMNGKEVEDGDLFTVALQEYHFMNMKENLDVEPEEAEKNGTAYEVATKCANVLQEYFKRHDHLEVDGDRRLVIRD
jgi:5'-nucleotidase